MVKDKRRATVEEQELTVSIPLNKVQLVMMISIPRDVFLSARVHTLMQVMQRLNTKPIIPEGIVVTLFI